MKIKIGILLLLFYNHGLCQTDSIRMFMFGHSLVNYESELTMGNEGAIAHWVYKFAVHDNHYYAATGQFGFLPQHANLPPTAQWGFAEVPSVWESDYEPFSEANFNQILMTAANFAQWQPSNVDYPTDPGISPLSATETIIDWIISEEDNVTFYIYENWPDMAPYLDGNFPATQSQFENYNNYTRNEFNDWWIEYQDFLLSSRPEANVRMIPVGPIMAKLHQELLANQIPLELLYEDDAPHGRSSTYFLASMITYMAIFEKPILANYNIPSSIHPAIQNQFEEIIGFIWEELLAFNLDNGDSRVFASSPTTTVQEEDALQTLFQISPNPSGGNILINAPKTLEVRIYDIFGNVFFDLNTQNNSDALIDISNLPSGLYIIEGFDSKTKQKQIQKLIKQ